MNEQYPDGTTMFELLHWRREHLEGEEGIANEEERVRNLEVLGWLIETGECNDGVRNHSKIGVSEYNDNMLDFGEISASNVVISEVDDVAQGAAFIIDDGLPPGLVEYLLNQVRDEMNEG